MAPPPTITHAAPFSPPTAAQMPLAALLSALGFTLADLLCRSPLVAPRISRAFARARGEKSESENESGGGGGTEKKGSDAAAGGDGSGRVHRRKEQSLVAVVEDAGIKLVGTLHVLLCLPLTVAVLSDKRRRSSSLSSSSSSSSFINIDSSDSDPRLLLYSSTPASRLLVSLSSGYFLWDIASILVRTYVSMTPRGKREGRSVGGGFLAHGKEVFYFSIAFFFFFSISKGKNSQEEKASPPFRFFFFLRDPLFTPPPQAPSAAASSASAPSPETSLTSQPRFCSSRPRPPLSTSAGRSPPPGAKGAKRAERTPCAAWPWCRASSWRGSFLGSNSRSSSGAPASRR